MERNSCYLTLHLSVGAWSLYPKDVCWSSKPHSWTRLSLLYSKSPPHLVFILPNGIHQVFKVSQHFDDIGALLHVVLVSRRRLLIDC